MLLAVIEMQMQAMKVQNSGTVDALMKSHAPSIIHPITLPPVLSCVQSGVSDLDVTTPHF